MKQFTNKRIATTQHLIQSVFNNSGKESHYKVKRAFSSFNTIQQSSNEQQELKKTPLYQLHDNQKATFVPFAGYKMPVMYNVKEFKDAMKREHMQCRKQSALFDVSHMGQVIIRGTHATQFLEAITPANLTQLKVGNCRLTQFTNDQGGIMDDLVITKKEQNEHEQKFYMVINAACIEQDMNHLRSFLRERVAPEVRDAVSIEFMNDKSLLALQGPKACDVLSSLLVNEASVEKVRKMKFMSSTDDELKLHNGQIMPCQITRCGYTGEDGFEISMHNDHATPFAETLLQTDGAVGLAGLGARDTLRIEAGLCLMGHDMKPDITPIEAGLSFTVGKKRRETGGFPGEEVILDQVKNGTKQKRIGFAFDGKVIAREGYNFKDLNTGETIGQVTSGTLSPVLNHPIGMGYINTEYAKEGTEIGIEIRKNVQKAKIVKMPFVEQNYYK